MSFNAVLIVKFVFVWIWKLFTQWHIPGTNVTPAAFGLFMLVVGISIRFLRRVSIENSGYKEDFPDNNSTDIRRL